MLSQPLPYLLMILRFGSAREHALGHRLEADDRGVAVLSGTRSVSSSPRRWPAVVELRLRIDVEHLLPHGRMAADVIGGDAEAVD